MFSLMFLSKDITFIKINSTFLFFVYTFSQLVTFYVRPFSLESSNNMKCLVSQTGEIIIIRVIISLLLLLLLLQLYGRFKRLINNILHEKTWTWLRKGNCKRETESLLIAAQNNTIRTNHIKARIDKSQQNSKCTLRGDRDETINNIISECRKLAQKEYKTKYNWVSKVIYWEMCKKFKFDQRRR